MNTRLPICVVYFKSHVARSDEPQIYAIMGWNDSVQTDGYACRRWCNCGMGGGDRWSDENTDYIEEMRTG